MLTNLRKTLRISDDEHQQIIDELRAASGFPPASTPVAPTPAPAMTTSMPSPVQPAFAPSPAPPSPSPQPAQVHPLGPTPGPIPTPTPISSPAQVAPDIPKSATISALEVDIRGGSHHLSITPTQATEREPAPTTASSIISSGIQRVSPAPKAAEQPASNLLEAAKGKRDEDLNFDECLELGKEAYRTGGYKRSVDLCDRALKLKPNNSQAIFFKKRSKSKMDEAAPASAVPAAQTSPQPTSDPMLSHMGAPKAAQTAVQSGSIIPKCLSCRDTHVCSWCKGQGLCWMCQGTGVCNTCKGSGTLNDAPCPKCKGSSKCDSCMGTGKCYWCKGTAKCHKCSKE